MGGGDRLFASRGKRQERTKCGRDKTAPMRQASSQLTPSFLSSSSLTALLCSTFKGTEHPTEHVIIGAHHDSRGSFLNPRAPGADDDGSGTTMLLQVARIIKANNLSFGRTFVIAAFSGEGTILCPCSTRSKSQAGVPLLLYSTRVLFHACLWIRN